jgi:hypothetical protein
MTCTDEHLVTVSLDRHLRVHEAKGQRKLLKKVYLKQRQLQVLLGQDGR